MPTVAATNESWRTTVPAPAAVACSLVPQSVIGVGESFRWSRAGDGVGAPACENQEEDGGGCGNRNHKRAHIVLPAFILGLGECLSERINFLRSRAPMVKTQQLLGSLPINSPPSD